jgi:glycosyltransferase involved in cell wall biosynthesis
MKILCVGIFSVPSSTNIQTAKAFYNRKHLVYCFDYLFYKKSMDFNRFHRNLLNRIEKIKLPFFERIAEINRFYLLGNWKVNRQLYQEVKNNNYDLVYLPKTPSINYKLISKLNEYTKTWYFFMDPLHQAIRINAHKYAIRSTWSSATFSSVNQLFQREGANSYHITEGYNPRIFNPGKNRIHKNIEVMFVGEITSKRKKYISFLRNNGINVEAYGPGWENKSIFINELALKYRKAKIVLNFTRDKVGFSDRVFHVLGTKTLLISEYCRDLEKFFKKGVHLEWFNSPEELLKLVRFYLENDDLQGKIAEQGYNFVIEHFTWEKIIDKIIGITQKN